MRNVEDIMKNGFDIKRKKFKYEIQPRLWCLRDFLVHLGSALAALW